MRESDLARSPDAHSGKRIIAIDAARGCAMLMVCLSHIKQYFEAIAPEVHWFLLTTTRIATPTFLLLSGFVIGHLLRADTRRTSSTWLIDRALFLLIIAHALLSFDEARVQGVVEALFSRAFITDAIAASLLLAVLLRRVSWRTLIALGSAMCLASWVLSIFLVLETGWARMLAGVLFHTEGAQGGALAAPVVPYVGLFLIGMGLSGWLHQPLLTRAERTLVRRLLIVGGGAVLLTAAGVLAWHFGKAQFVALLGDPGSAALLRQTLDPRSKWPPSPAYLLFYGGSGLLLLAFLFYGRPARLLDPFKRVTSVIGRASLMCFVVQQWLLVQIPILMGVDGITSAPFWVAWFLVSLLLLYALARLWDDANGNRFLTVGLRAWRKRRMLAAATPSKVAQH